MGSIFGVAKKGFGMLKKASKATKKAVVDEPLFMTKKDYKKLGPHPTGGKIVKKIIKKKGPKVMAISTAATTGLELTVGPSAKRRRNKKKEK